MKVVWTPKRDCLGDDVLLEAVSAANRIWVSQRDSTTTNKTFVFAGRRATSKSNSEAILYGRQFDNRGQPRLLVVSAELDIVQIIGKRAAHSIAT